MSHCFLHMSANQNQEYDVSNISHAAPHVSRTTYIEERLSVAYPRLRRLAQAAGVPADAVEDVVQETMIAAWRHLDHLRASDRFDAWLDRICRNAAYQYHRRLSQREDLFTEHPEIEFALFSDCSPLVSYDPVEEFDHQALTVLLDRALSFLSLEARQILEAHYLAEIPQRELALQLGITIRALESRLHRARRHLRQILCTDLQADAADFGLLPVQQPLLGWRETRLWCNLCGRQRLVSTFETCGQGSLNFRLRCPECGPRFGLDAIDSDGTTYLAGVRSARPALKRTMQSLIAHFSQALQVGYEICPCCESVAPVRVVSPEEGSFPLPQKFWLRSDCPSCGLRLRTLDDLVCWPHPSLQQFLTTHPRHITEPDIVVTYAGQEAIRFRWSSMTGPACLNVLAHRETLQILTTFQE